MKTSPRPADKNNTFMKSFLFAEDQNQRQINLKFKRGFSNTPLIIEKQSKHVENLLKSSNEHRHRKNKSFEAPKKISPERKINRLNTSLTSDLDKNFVNGDQSEERELFSKFIRKLDTREMDYKRSKRNLSLLKS
jgi:hypothetical protein